MNKFYLVIIIFFTLFQSFTQAQNVFPKYEDKPVWCVIEWGFGTPTFGYSIELKPDTILCGQTYNPVWINNYILYAGDTISGIIGYVRTEGSKVYLNYGDCNFPEVLLYDFDLMIGDTIIHSSYNVKGVVIKVEYEDFNNIQRKTLLIEYPQPALSSGGPTPPPIRRKWVEGMGDLFHPFKSIDCLSPSCEFGAILSCLTFSNTIIYGNCKEPCYISNDTIQNKSAFPTYADGTVWCMKKLADPFWNWEFEYSLELMPDTTICGRIYSPILAKNYVINANGDKVNSIIGYVRQEGKKVYQFSKQNCEEFLLYDFSLKIGDTIKHVDHNVIFNVIVNDIHYQNIYGNIRKVFTIFYWNSYMFEVHYWVEGLGNPLHPLLKIDCYTGTACEGIEYSLCISDKNGVQYGTCPEGCALTTDVDDIFQEQSQLYISPNPVRLGESLQVNYHFPKATAGQWIVTNMLGQALYQQAFQAGSAEGNIVLSWSPSVAGVYWLIWQDHNGNRQSVKFISQ